MAPLSAALANGDDTLSITADCYSVAAADAAIAAALLAYYTSAQVDALLGDYRTGAAQDADTTSAITGALLAYYTAAQVDALLGDYRAASAQDTQTQAAITGALLGARTKTCSQPTKSPRRAAYRSAADQAAIGEQILGPTDVSLSNWTVRPSSVVLATHTAGVSVDGTLTLEHRAHLQLDARARAALRLPLPARHGLQLRGAHVRGRASWATRAPGARPRCASQCRQTEWQSCTLVRTSRRRVCPTTAGTVDVYGLQILDATLEAGNTEEDTAAHAHTLGNFLVRSNSQSSVALASFAVGGFQLEGYAMTLSTFAWNIVRYTLTPGRRYSFGCRYRLGTASNLVMYVSAADNDYVGVTGTFLGTPSQGVWSTPRLDFSVPPGGVAKDQHLRLLGRSLPHKELGGLEQAASVQQQRGPRQRTGAEAAPVRAHHDQRRGAGADEEPLDAAVPDHEPDKPRLPRDRGQHGQRGLQHELHGLVR